MRLHRRSMSAAATSWTNPSSTLSLERAEVVTQWREYGEVTENGGGIMAWLKSQTFDAKAQRREESKREKITALCGSAVRSHLANGPTAKSKWRLGVFLPLQ